MTDIEERFAGNGDDESLIERQLLSRASVKRESCCCPTKNGVANLAPLRFCRYFLALANCRSVCHNTLPWLICVLLDVQELPWITQQP
jgi:hypothetical protein